MRRDNIGRLWLRYDPKSMLVRSNFAPSRLKNGDLVTVEEVKGDGSLVVKDGRSIPNHFRQFTHGYATTSHAAQGKTVDHGILILGEKGCRAANLKQAYVSNSRFRQSQNIFTSDKDAAFDSMAHDTERALALETIKKAEPTNEYLKPKEVQVEKTSLHPKGTALDWTPALVNPAIRI